MFGFSSLDFTDFINCLIILDMAKANSFKSEPWTQLERGSYTIFEDDFLSDKIVFKATKKGSASTIALKESFQISRDSKSIKNDEELKFWFPFRDTHTLYFRLKSDSYKIHYDNGIHENDGYKFNWYASVQGKNNFSGDNYKAGLEIQKKQFSTNYRVSVRPLDLAVNLYNKFTYTHNKFSFGTVNAFQVFTNDWIHSAFQLAWQDNNGNDIYLRANAGKKYEKINFFHYLANVTANYIYKLNSNNNLGLQVKGNLATRQFSDASFIWDHKCESSANTGIKVKADLKRNVAASIKNAIPGFGSYILGVNIHDLGGANRFTYGVQLDLNV